MEKSMMNRKEFLKLACRLGMISGAIALAGGPGKLSAQTETTEKAAKAVEMKKKFKEFWVTNLMENMDSNLGEDLRIKLMEECGRDCARSSAIKQAEKYKGVFDGFLSYQKQFLGEENVTRKDNTVTLVLHRCYCPLVADGPEKLSDTYCYCSRGWIKEMFGTVTGKECGVKIIETVKRGGKTCSFEVAV